MNLKTTIKKTLRNSITFESHPKLFWQYRAIKLALSSGYNAVRNNHEKKIAESFNSYLSRFEKDERINLINNLKQGLDSVSQKEVDTMLHRQEYILRHNLLEQKKLWTKEELLEQKVCKKETGKIRRKIRKFNITNYSSESFYGLSGLRWLPEEKKKDLKDGIFLDLGAFDGDSSLALHFAFSPQTIYAFGPEKNNFLILQKNSQLIRRGVIEPVKMGVSNVNKTEFISSRDTASKIEKTGEEIKITTIDEFASNQEIKVNLIKMDIEGEEKNAILGAKDVIKKYKPTLAISIYHRPEDFFEIKPLLKELVPEYKFIIKKANPLSLAHELMLLAYI